MVMGRPQRQRAGVTLAAASVLSRGAVGPGGSRGGACVVEAHLVRRVDMVHMDHVLS